MRKGLVDRIRRPTLALAVVALVAPAAAWGQRDPEPSGWRIAGQVSVATVVAPAAFVGGGLGARWLASKLGASPDGARKVAYVGAWSLAALGTSVVPPLLLRGGNYTSSLAGTALGGIAGGLVVWVGRIVYADEPGCGVVCTALGLAAFALPATGATILYNRSR